MTTASQYISTGNVQIKDRAQSKRFVNYGGITYDTSIEGLGVYLNSVNGNTLITPFHPGPRSFFWENYDGLTLSILAKKDYAFLKSLPQSRRALQNFNSYEPTNSWIEEGITIANASFNGYTGTWSRQIVPNKYPTPWPIKGLSQAYKLLADWLKVASLEGITIQALMIDNESSPYDPTFFDTALYNVLSNDSRYKQEYFGLTSWEEIYTDYGGSGYQRLNPFNIEAWWAAKDAYQAKAFQLSYLQAMLEHNPNSLTSNYTYFKEGEPLLSERKRNSVWSQDGRALPHLEPGGNAAAPELYGGMRGTRNGRFVKLNDGKNLDIGGITNNFRPLNKKMNLGPWASFILTLAEARSAKRGSPETPLTPWVGSVDWTGPLYCLFSKEYEIIQTYPWGIGYLSPPEVLHTTTLKYNILSLTKGYTGEFEGFTGWNGSTASFRVVTPKLGVTGGSGGIWYKSNIKGLTYDGSTAAYKISYNGSTGITASLALYYGQPLLTSGQTYIFSYYVDLDRGFTGFDARFITWSTSNDIATIPNRPTTTTVSSGITFQQILPVTGGIVTSGLTNGFTGIQFNPGDSGWTKIAWQLVSPAPSTTTGIGLHVYYLPSSKNTSGNYETYIKDVSFSTDGGTAINVNPIDINYQPIGPRSIYQSPTTNSSLEYFYDGITKGITYIFSYYRNLNIGSTLAPPNAQLIEHFKSWTYNYPRGITFNRILPSATGPFFSTGPANFSGYSGWTEISYEFTPTQPFDDIDSNNTLKISLINLTNSYSVMDGPFNVTGLTAYFAHPRLQVKGITENIDLYFREPTDEYNYALWCESSPSGFADLKLGYNSRQGVYISRKDLYLENMDGNLGYYEGNSGYYYDYIRHLALLGTKYFGYFNPSQFVDMGFTGALRNWAEVYNFGTNAWFVNTQSYQNGWTGWLDEQTTFNNFLKGINERLGGFTTTTADYSEYDWNSTYMANGAPSLGGNTWWWRVTVKPGYTMICNGVTLSARPNYPVGTWVTTTGPTLAGIGITWNAWELPGEPGYTAPTKVFNFVGMTYNNQVKEAGFNFTRNSIATYIGSSGYLMTAAINEPRLDYDPDTLESKGLILEEGTTNYLNWSETFATSGGCNNNWIDLNISRTTGNTSPSGNTTAIRFTATGANGTLIMSNGVTTGLLYGSWSCWFRGMTGIEDLSVTLDGGTSWSQISNLSTKWKRFGSDLTESTVGIFNSPFHLGFKLGNTNDSVEIWGAQVEEAVWISGSLRLPVNPLVEVQYTSYIPTTNTRVTREDEKCEITGISFSSWFGITQGTFLFDSVNSGQIVISNSLAYFTGPLLYQVGVNATIAVGRYGTYQTVSCQGPGYWPFPQSGYPLNYPIKTMFTYNPEGLKISYGGNLESSPYSGITQLIYNYNTLSLTTSFGQTTSKGNSQNHTKKIIYWNYVWSDADIKAMTKANVEPTTIFNPYG